MNEIVQMVAQKFNIAPETAQQIVSFILEQVKGKLPEGIAQQLDTIVAQGAGNKPSEKAGLVDSVKNMAVEPHGQGLALFAQSFTDAAVGWVRNPAHPRGNAVLCNRGTSPLKERVCYIFCGRP